MMKYKNPWRECSSTWSTPPRNNQIDHSGENAEEKNISVTSEPRDKKEIASCCHFTQWRQTTTEINQFKSLCLRWSSLKQNNEMKSRPSKNFLCYFSPIFKGPASIEVASFSGPNQKKKKTKENRSVRDLLLLFKEDRWRLEKKKNNKEVEKERKRKEVA